MCLRNFSISNLETTEFLQSLLHNWLVDHSREITQHFSVSYFGGVLICMYALVFFVYVAGIAIIGLLSIMYEDNKRQLQTLRQLLETQDTKINSMEKELEKQKLDTQTMYSTFVYDLGDRETILRGHGQHLTDHANNILKIMRSVQSNTATCSNHSEILQRLIHHMNEQNKAIQTTHLEVDQHTQQLKQMEPLLDNFDGLSQQVSNCMSYIDAVDESFEEFAQQMSQDHCQLEMKLDDALAHFNSTTEKLADQLEEHENELYSVEEEMFHRIGAFSCVSLLHDVETSTKSD
jgi:chromosome segregation ATPase